jgi:Flp pilus assembly protein TadG
MTRRFAPRGADGESGAYAILYGVVILAVVGVAAIVVDLGQLRQNRRSTRLAADAAAVAGARDLDTVKGTANPRQACTDAWGYLATNLGFTAPSLAVSGCTSFPTTSATPCTTVVKTATGTVGDFTVTITWPVVNSSSLLTKPNVQPAAPVQPIDTKVDGTDPCARIGISVTQVSHPAFAGIFGTGDVSTVVSSVARATSKAGGNSIVAALNVLNKTECSVVQTKGQGFIQVKAVGTQPGVISVESNGHPGGGNCPSATPWVVDASTNASGGFIRADGAPTGTNPTGAGLGTILAYAMNPSPTGNPSQAYNPAALTMVPAHLGPAPTVLGARSGVTPVTDIYECATSSCQYVSALKAAFGKTGLPTPYSGAGVFKAAAFGTLPGAAVPAFKCSMNSGDPVVKVPAGNWWVNCPSGLSVKNTLVFTGGNVVTEGGISTSNGGCVAFNTPNALPVATCPLVNALTSDLVTPPTSEGILYVRSGTLSRTGGSIFTARTFTYLASGYLDLGGGAGTVFMTNPKPDTSTCDTDCQAGRFGKLALWSESTHEQAIGGQGSLYLTGVLYVPNSTFNYSGQAAQVQVGAQFWADKLLNTGQGGLAMAPDPDNVIPTPRFAVALIR